jgi:hypothetical protein
MRRARGAPESSIQLRGKLSATSMWRATSTGLPIPRLRIPTHRLMFFQPAERAVKGTRVLGTLPLSRASIRARIRSHP